MGRFIKKYLTIDDLLSFCAQSKMDNFSAKDAGGPIIVQSFGEIKTEDTTMAGLTPCTLHACHTELNKNKSFIKDTVMNNALASFANRPILGYIHQLEDGSWNFWDHRMSIEEDGDDCRVEFLERPIGVVPESCNAHLEYDKDQQKKYVVVNGYIYDDYGNRALDIIKDNDGKVDVSVELAINAMSYNAKEDYLNIEDFTFMGVTCLGKTPDGTTVMPGMEGSNLKLDNFSVKENSMFAESYQDKMIEVLEKLNITLSNFNTNTTQKGGNKMKFEELLAKYGKTAEEVTFEIEGLSDEELEAKFAEVFENTDGNNADEGEADGNNGEGDNTNSGDSGDGEGDNDNDNDDDDDGNGEGDGDPKSQSEENFILKYELSHDDIRSALYSLLAAISEEGYYYTWIVEVYDDKFIYCDYKENKFYRQGYSKDGDSVTLGDNKVEVFSEWLSGDEKDALDKLKADYSTLKEFKDNCDAAELKAQKNAVLTREEYSVLAEDESFKSLIADAEKYSVEELEIKADVIFAKFVKANGEYSVKNDTNKPNTLGFNFNAKPSKKKQAYGGLFSTDD